MRSPCCMYVFRFMKLCMCIVVPETSLIAFFVNPSDHSVSLYVSLWPWGRLRLLTEMSTRIFWGVKSGRRARLTAFPPSVNRLSRENVGASTSHKPMGLHGLLQG
jgi:cytochrome b